MQQRQKANYYNFELVRKVDDLPGLSAHEKLVVREYAKCVNRDCPERGVWVSKATIAKKAGLSLSTVKRTVVSLTGKGILRCIARGGWNGELGKNRGSTYVICIPRTGGVGSGRTEGSVQTEHGSGQNSQRMDGGSGQNEPRGSGQVEPLREIRVEEREEKKKNTLLRLSKSGQSKVVDELVVYGLNNCQLSQAGSRVVRSEITNLLGEFSEEEIRLGFNRAAYEWQGLGEFKQGSTNQAFFLRDGLRGFILAGIQKRKELSRVYKIATEFPRKPLYEAPPEEEESGGTGLLD
jgi:hypothetical protein